MIEKIKNMMFTKKKKKKRKKSIDRTPYINKFTVTKFLHLHIWNLLNSSSVTPRVSYFFQTPFIFYLNFTSSIITFLSFTSLSLLAANCSFLSNVIYTQHWRQRNNIPTCSVFCADLTMRCTITSQSHWSLTMICHYSQLTNLGK